MMMSDVMDKRIRPLVATMNARGFNTFASCEGHGFPADSRLPCVAFYCGTAAAARLEALLRGDAESLNPELNWGWTVAGTFNSAGELGFAMRPARPHFIWSSGIDICGADPTGFVMSHPWLRVYSLSRVTTIRG
ncbi:hypothetical protein MUA04_02725 [Enterobacteriaceae bacterium H11S18]|uniref:hypothetical protein n=1 Tax=Dryocola clanedunensis TaxID=2925396 RepID=UPI0022F05BD6|nr:hypothetical protein [Dryocola clanedunensis]MCT4709122.1 hypothetical protein [Dryocola clanedunensis]